MIAAHPNEILDVTSDYAGEVHDVLWTSGWDSTFRVVDLLSQGKAVRPWYVLAEAYPRASAKKELETMREIRLELAERDPAVRQLLLPLHVVRESDLPKRRDVDLAVRSLREKHGVMATQYEFLASLADTLGTTMELGLHRGGLAEVFLKGQTAENIESGEITLKEDADPDMLTVFGNMAFPLSSLTKLEMGEIAEERGFSDIMERTWFCSTPVFGEPCGQCSPCLTASRTGMGHRVPAPTLPRRVGFYFVRWKTKNSPQKIKLNLYRAVMGLVERAKNFA